MVGKTFDVAYTTTSNGLEIDCSNYAAGVYTFNRSKQWHGTIRTIDHQEITSIYKTGTVV